MSFSPFMWSLPTPSGVRNIFSFLLLTAARQQVPGLPPGERTITRVACPVGVPAMNQRDRFKLLFGPYQPPALWPMLEDMEAARWMRAYLLALGLARETASVGAGHGCV